MSNIVDTQCFGSDGASEPFKQASACHHNSIQHISYVRTGRNLSQFSENPTYQIAIIVGACIVGALLLGIAILLLVLKCRKKNAVHPEATSKHQDMEAQRNTAPSAPFPPRQAFQPTITAPTPPEMVLPGGLQPTPPWETQGQPPPGIVLAPNVPISFNPWTSNPRPPGAPPYDRLILISSRVHEPIKVAESALPNVAVVVYDWKRFTLQELLSYIKRTIGPGTKVTSIAVVAPGNTPGSVALLEGQTSSTDKLIAGGEMTQFWRVLSGCVAANGVSDGRRIDLLGCRLLEAPAEAAALLKALWVLTSVPFTAADDAIGGYQLATFLEEPNSQALSIITSTIKGIDLYFDRYKLLGLAPPGNAATAPRQLAPLPSTVYAPLPAGPVPTSARAPAPGPGSVASAPTNTGTPSQQPYTTPGTGQVQAQPQQVVSSQGPVSQVASPVPPSQPNAQKSAAVAEQPIQSAAAAAAATMSLPPPKDIFARFMDAVHQMGMSPQQVFARYDRDGGGYLTQQEITAMVAQVVPGTSNLDETHFRRMLDLDGNQEVTMAEFVKALSENSRISEAARAGKDPDSLFAQLATYMNDFSDVIAQHFADADRDGSGALDHDEVVELFANIPGLRTDEQKLICSYLYQYDTSGKGALTFAQVKEAIESYGTPSARKITQTPFPAQAAAMAKAAPPPAVPSISQQQRPSAVPSALMPSTAAPPASTQPGPVQVGSVPAVKSGSDSHPSAASTAAAALPVNPAQAGPVQSVSIQSVQQPAPIPVPAQLAPGPSTTAFQPTTNVVPTIQPQPLNLQQQQQQILSGPGEQAGRLPPAYQVLAPSAQQQGSVLAASGQRLVPLATPGVLGLPSVQQPGLQGPALPLGTPLGGGPVFK